MAFELKNTVPWGRNFEEYKSMFGFSDADLSKSIISFGDGPASFNFEMYSLGKKVVSIDPVYRFSVEEVRKRINETKDVVVEQTKKNLSNFVWTKIKDVKELEKIRISAMENFLKDFEVGKKEGRYINHEMPARTAFDDLSFDIGISSHFLILYSQLGLDFHIDSIAEMLRVAREVRIFPILNLDAKKSELLDGIIKYFEPNFTLNIVKVDYEFQKNGNEMLTIKRK